MASFHVEYGEIEAAVEKIAKATIDALNIRAIVRQTVAEAVAQHMRPRAKTWYSARETSELLNISMVALQARRVKGTIEGKQEPGVRSYRYHRSEIERVL